jgi:WD40 repeat protein
LRLWELETGYEQDAFVGHTGWVRAVDSIVVDGIPIALSGADDGAVRMWDLLNGVPMGVLGRHGAGVNGISCALDSSGLPVAFTVGDDSRICAWDLRARKLSSEVALPYPGWAVTLAPQDELVIAFGWEIAVYKSTTGMGWLRS